MQSQVLKYAAGIDVSKKELEVCFKELSKDQSTQIKGSRKFSNNARGFLQLQSWIEKRRSLATIPLVLIMEATGIYHEQAAYYFSENKYSLSVVLPNQAKDYLKSLGYKSKTDKIDAKGLSQLGIERSPRLWQAPSPHIRQLRHLTRYKNRLEKMKTRLLNTLHAQKHCAYGSDFVMNHLHIQITEIKEHIKQTKKAIITLMESDNAFNKKAQKIADSISGVGIATIACIAAETNGFELFHSQAQLCSYAGYDIIENQSGQRSGKTRISKKGNSHIRHALHFPALNIVRAEVPTFYDLYQRVYQANKVKMKGYVAVQRKLLCLIYTLWKTDEAFDPNYQDNQLQQTTPSTNS